MSESDRERRYGENRQRVARQLRAATKDEDIIGFRIELADECCALCDERADELFDARTSTLKELPPYLECMLEGGCPSHVVEVRRDEATPRRSFREYRRSARLWWARHRPQLHLSRSVLRAGALIRESISAVLMLLVSVALAYGYAVSMWKHWR